MQETREDPGEERERRSVPNQYSIQLLTSHGLYKPSCGAAICLKRFYFPIETFYFNYFLSRIDVLTRDTDHDHHLGLDVEYFSFFESSQPLEEAERRKYLCGESQTSSDACM